VMTQLQQRDQGRLQFFGGKHPVYPIDTGVFEELHTRLESHPRVEVQPMVAHADLIEAYRHAHVAIDLMTRNPERELAFTTRTVEYLWCGLPVIYNNYAELSPLIREYQAGWTLDPADHGALQQAVTEVFEQPERLRAYSGNAQRLVRERLTWDRTIDPLDEFCRAPTRRLRDRSAATPPEAQSFYLVGRGWNVLRRRGVSALWQEMRAYARWRLALRRMR
jgi:glycosyltransferase involved in cell wall biosynthesis